MINALVHRLLPVLLAALACIVLAPVFAVGFVFQETEGWWQRWCR
jgi:type III secretory pathway component EscU